MWLWLAVVILVHDPRLAVRNLNPVKNRVKITAIVPETAIAGRIGQVVAELSGFSTGKLSVPEN